MNAKMDKPNVQASCNWKRIGGCEFSENVRCDITREDIFIKPELDKILENENAVLLKLEGSAKESCELHLKLQQPTYKIESVSLVCTAPKLELFLGALSEYVETLYGELTEEIDNDGKVFSYRYDIEIQKSGITELTLRLLTSSNEVCIFGTYLQIAPNPNGITTGTNFDLSKLMLSAVKDKPPPSEPCMLFLQKIAQLQGARKSHTTAFDSQADVDLANENKENVAYSIAASPPPQATPAIIAELKTYLDNRLVELEFKIMEHLNIAMTQQNSKLDKIIKLLESKENV